MIKLSRYKVKRGYYHGTHNEIITIPSNIVYLTGGKQDVGHSLSSGHCHYIGIVKGNYNDISDQVKGLAVSVHKFNSEYCFITLSDIQFISEAPEIINPDILSENAYSKKLVEWNSQIDFNKYYIAFYSKDFKLVKMAKIRQIKSEYEIDVLLVYNFNESSIEYRSIVWSNMELHSFLLDGYSTNSIGKVVEGELSDKYWNTLVYNVLKPLQLDFIDTTKLDTLQLSEIDRAHKIASDFICSSRPFYGKNLEDLLNMKTI